MCLTLLPKKSLEKWSLSKINSNQRYMYVANTSEWNCLLVRFRQSISRVLVSWWRHRRRREWVRCQEDPQQDTGCDSHQWNLGKTCNIYNHVAHVHQHFIHESWIGLSPTANPKRGGIKASLCLLWQTYGNPAKGRLTSGWKSLRDSYMHWWRISRVVREIRELYA